MTPLAIAAKYAALLALIAVDTWLIWGLIAEGRL
jgi:hypothetical protein